MLACPRRHSSLSLASYNHTLLREAIRDAYAAEAVTALAPRSPNYRCPPPELSRSTSRFSFGTTDVLIQFVAIRRCYAMLVAAEQRRGQQYAYVMRLRTDILYMEDMPIAAILKERGEQQVFVPQFGMGPPQRSNRCLNDHLFVCPRRMCRPLFELLEIFENPYCTENTVAGSIFFSSQSLERPPSAPFFLWHPPSSVSSQAYILARHSANATMIAKALTSRCDGEPECGCGHGSQVTQLRWIYTIVAQSSVSTVGARGGAARSTGWRCPSSKPELRAARRRPTRIDPPQLSHLAHLVVCSNLP